MQARAEFKVRCTAAHLYIRRQRFPEHMGTGTGLQPSYGKSTIVGRMYINQHLVETVVAEWVAEGVSGTVKYYTLLGTDRVHPGSEPPCLFVLPCAEFGCPHLVEAPSLPLNTVCSSGP